MVTKKPSLDPYDPVLHPPEWYALTVGQPTGIFGRPITDVDAGYNAIYLGEINGHRAVILHYAQGDTLFRWGCRQFDTEAEVRAHFTVDGVSTTSGFERPHAIRLIDYVADICKHKGWKW